MFSFIVVNLIIFFGKECFIRRFVCGLLEYEEFWVRSDEVELFIIFWGIVKFYYFKILFLMK